MASLDKQTSISDVIASLEDGMTIGVGGWGSRRKPMSLVRALARSSLRDLTLVAYGGPDVGLLCTTKKLKRVVYGFVSLDSIPLEPYFRAARQTGEIEVTELDEGMLQWGLYAAALRLPFLPTRAGLGSDIMRVNPDLKLVQSPYADGESLVAMPALTLDVAFIHAHRADTQGNAQFLGPDPYFDDLFCRAAKRTYVSCEELVSTEALTEDAPLASLAIHRMNVTGVVHSPGGAHFTDCNPAYGRDEAFQKAYAAASKTPDDFARFFESYVALDEEAYQAKIQRERREGNAQ